MEFNQIIDKFGQELTVDDKLFNELESNLKEAVNIAKGRVAPKTAYIVVTPAGIKAIRRKVKTSQAGF